MIKDKIIQDISQLNIFEQTKYRSTKGNDCFIFFSLFQVFLNTGQIHGSGAEFGMKVHQSSIALKLYSMASSPSL
jgi:hypothetical protein